MRKLTSNHFVFLIFAAAISFAEGAVAQIMEPDGFGPVPVDARSMCNKSSTLSPNPNGTIGCTGTSDIGDFACCSNTLDNMSLIGLFKYFESDAAGNSLIDVQRDAKTEPATFIPLCSIQANMVMHGSGCQVGFGWYCVDASNSYSNPPTIHPLMSASDVQAYAADPGNVYPTVWKNNDGAFLPKTGYSIAGNRISNLVADPDFQACASKRIGFAVLGGTAPSGTGVCTQNKYSETRLNQVNTPSGKPYIDAIIYPSKTFPGRFYIAMEDLPTSPSQFNAPVAGKGWTADGDFNDLVYTVDGVVCPGGGQLCAVPGKAGLCATGVMSCSDLQNGTAGSCEAVFKPQVESCNSIDDDCDGVIDNGANLCPAGQICRSGSCVNSCQATGEFACPSGQVCVGQTCVEPSCATVTCDARMRCVAGQCIDECEGVTCPAGQECSQGNCIDLCNARGTAGLPDCPANFVCQWGACVPNCTCLPCPDATLCQSDASKPGFGRCVMPAGLAGTGGVASGGGGATLGGSATAVGGNPICFACSGGATVGGQSGVGGVVSSGGNSTGGFLLTGGKTSAFTGSAGGTSASASTLCEPGSETCPCYGNDTCNAGLVCASHLCVALSGGASSTNATQDAGVKSGCSCRIGRTRDRAFLLTALTLGWLASYRRRRVAKVVAGETH